MSLLTPTKARQLWLKGVDKDVTVTKVGAAVEHLPTKQYAVPMTDEMGHEWIVYAYGMEEIMTKVNICDLRRIFGTALEVPLLHPHGKVDVFIGAGCCCALPQVVIILDNLQLMITQFGFCLDGHHPSLRARCANSHTVQVHNLSLLTDSSDVIFEHFKSIKEKLDNHLLIDHWDMDCKPKCYNCRMCRECSKEKSMTMKEEREMNMIPSGLVHNAESKCCAGR